MTGGAVAFASITFTILYCVMGVGTITLVRLQNKKIPKLLAIVWWILLIFAAFGMVDKED